MSRHRSDPHEIERELLLRYGIEPNPYADHFQEQELADRIREQAPLTQDRHAAWQLACARRGLERPPDEPRTPPRHRPLFGPASR
jgi:hypothetical protein